MTINELDEFINKCKSANIDVPSDIIYLIDNVLPTPSVLASIYILDDAHISIVHSDIGTECKVMVKGNDLKVY